MNRLYSTTVLEMLVTYRKSNIENGKKFKNFYHKNSKIYKKKGVKLARNSKI